MGQIPVKHLQWCYQLQCWCCQGLKAHVYEIYPICALSPNLLSIHFAYVQRTRHWFGISAKEPWIWCYGQTEWLLLCVHVQKEITHSDGDDAQADYEELYVHISAETFEKVDAAVALIELLVTPVSVSQCTIFFFFFTYSLSFEILHCIILILC